MVTERDIAVFYGIVAVTLFALRLFPNSHLTRIAFTWFGPAPIQGESKSHYFGRWSLYAFIWFCQLLAVELAPTRFSRIDPTLSDNFIFQGFSFGISLLGLTALAGAVVYTVGTFKARMFGPNPRFDLEDMDTDSRPE